MRKAKSMQRWRLVVLMILGLTEVGASLSEATSGKITGKVVDAQDGEALPGVNVIVDGTTMGAATDLEGYFAIPGLQPGVYKLVVSMIGYSEVRVANVKVISGEIAKVNVALKMETLAGEEVIVEAEALRNTEVTLLKDRMKAAAVSDAISAQAMSQSGASDAGAAMTRVTGVSVVDGKYVYVRGMGERYGMTQLNGAMLPSADPEKKSVQMDLFPTHLLDNIVTVKTATPDKPGNFAGGYVDIGTKSFPETYSLTFSAASSGNSQTALEDGFLTYQGGTRDWLGIDDGTRAIPSALADPNVEIPDIGSSFTNAAKAQRLDELTKSFNPYMAPTQKKAPLDQSYAFSLAVPMRVLGRPVGLVGSLSYNRNFFSYHSGVSGRWQLTGNVSEVESLTNDFLFSDDKSVDEVLWGGLTTLSIKPHDRHELGLSVMYNRGGEQMSRYQHGLFPRDLSANQRYETRVLSFKERELTSLQGRGDHHLPALGNLQVEWRAAYANSKQDEPDLRFFTDNYTMTERESTVDTTYTIRPSIYPVPTRYYRALGEDMLDSKLDMTLPFRQWQGFNSKLKFGGAYLTTDRTFRERRFELRQDRIKYDGKQYEFFQPQNMGILADQSTGSFYRFGNYVVDASQPSSNYNGNQDIGAVYGMVDLPLNARLRFIGGTRYEATDIHAASLDSTLQQGEISERDWLPSANLVYALSEAMNLRAAFSRTLARPTFRELAPYASFDFVGDYIFVGNVNLQRTLIRNYDLRWEWFSRPGEIYAVSGFYKVLNNPIERVINPRAAAASPEIQYRNVDEAVVYGAEFEVRKRLDGLMPALRNFEIGGNFSLIKSRVDIASDELQSIRAVDPNASSTRPLQGQSPFVVNASLSYDNFSAGTAISLQYNVFGKRLSEVTTGGTPDIYEQPRHLIDLIYSQKLWNRFALKLTAKNLLNEKFQKAHSYKGALYSTVEYDMGRTLGLSMSYSAF